MPSINAMWSMDNATGELDKPMSTVNKPTSAQYRDMKRMGYKGPDGPHLRHATQFTRTGEHDYENRVTEDRPFRQAVAIARQNEAKIAKANKVRSKK